MTPESRTSRHSVRLLAERFELPGNRLPKQEYFSVQVPSA